MPGKSESPHNTPCPSIRASNGPDSPTPILGLPSTSRRIPPLPSQAPQTHPVPVPDPAIGGPPLREPPPPSAISAFAARSGPRILSALGRPTLFHERSESPSPSPFQFPSPSPFQSPSQSPSPFQFPSQSQSPSPSPSPLSPQLGVCFIDVPRQLAQITI
jgi:hypothetical protein